MLGSRYGFDPARHTQTPTEHARKKAYLEADPAERNTETRFGIHFEGDNT